MNRREFTGLLGGAAAAWPLAVRAQQAAMPAIGFLSSRSADDSARVVAAFREGLAETGYVDGRNATIEFRWAQGEFDRLGANVTGATFFTALLGAKRLGLLRDLVPKAEMVGLLVNQHTSQGQGQIRDVQQAARDLGLRLLVLNGGSDEDIEAAFAGLAPQGVATLLVGADPFFDTRRDQLIALVARHRVPAVYQFRDYALAGGLMSYGANITDLYRQVGLYVGRILKGEKPADLPVMLPTKFELVINLKAAKALGIDISANLLTLADEVIE